MFSAFGSASRKLTGMISRTARLAVVTGALVPALSGCVAKLAYDVATAPVRIAREAVDVATTSQSEADEKRGRALRRREERVGSRERSDRTYEMCQRGNKSSCAQIRTPAHSPNE